MRALPLSAAAAAAAALALLAALPLPSRGEETQDLLRAKIVASLEKNHHKGKTANPCQISQTAFNTAAESLLHTTTTIYQTVLANGWQVPKCPANPAQCQAPTNTTTPVDLVAVFTNLEVADQSQPSLASLFSSGNLDIETLDNACTSGEANKCSWSSVTSNCG